MAIKIEHDLLHGVKAVAAHLGKSVCALRSALQAHFERLTKEARDGERS